MLLRVPIPSAQGCSWTFLNLLPTPPCPNQATQLFLATGCLVLSQSARGQLSPDVFGGCLAVPLDGRALIFVVEPGRSLAGPVAVMGKLALPAAVEPLLPLEAGVTDDVCQAGRTEGHVGSARASSAQRRSCQLCTPGVLKIFGKGGEISHPA